MGSSNIESQIAEAFDTVPPPPRWCLVDSREGTEPELVEREFRDKTDWRTLSARFLDDAPAGLASALSFLSDEAFRYFLPAYLMADLRGQLERVDVVFHLTHGLNDAGKNEMVNPLRYGARSSFEAASHRLSTLDAAQAGAVVAYLEYKIDFGELVGFEQARVEEALRNFWRPRAASGVP